MAIRFEELRLLPVLGRKKKDYTFDAFISYPRGDRPFVEQLVTQLQEKNLKPWYDRFLLPGKRWNSGIGEVIKKSRSAVVILGSKGYTKYQAFEIETLVNEFIELDLPVIPAIIPGWNDEIPMILKSFHWVDFREDYEEALEQLIQGIINSDSKSRNN